MHDDSCTFFLAIKCLKIVHPVFGFQLLSTTETQLVVRLTNRVWSSSVQGDTFAGLRRPQLTYLPSTIAGEFIMSPTQCCGGNFMVM